MDLERMTVEVQELLPAAPESVFALLSDVERMGGLGQERPEKAEQYVAGRAAELERNMRATLRAAADLLEQVTPAGAPPRAAHPA